MQEDGGRRGVYWSKSRVFCFQTGCFVVRRGVLQSDGVFCSQTGCFAVRQGVLLSEKVFCCQTGTSRAHETGAEGDVRPAWRDRVMETGLWRQRGLVFGERAQAGRPSVGDEEERGWGSGGEELQGRDAREAEVWGKAGAKPTSCLLLPGAGGHLALQVLHSLLQPPGVQVEVDVQFPLLPEEGTVLQLRAFLAHVAHDFLHEAVQGGQLGLYVCQAHRQLLERRREEGGRREGGRGEGGGGRGEEGEGGREGGGEREGEGGGEEGGGGGKGRGKTWRGVGVVLVR